MIADAFLFYNDFAAVEMRFAELYDTVDRFFVVSSPWRYSLLPNRYDFNNHDWSKYEDKIVYDRPKMTKANVEQQSWSYLKGMVGEHIGDDFVLTMSDADEVPRAAVYEVPIEGVSSLSMDGYRYNFRTIGPEHTKAKMYTSWEHVDPYHDRRAELKAIPDAGWHLSLFMGTEDVIQRIPDVPLYEIPERIKHGLCLYGTEVFEQREPELARLPRYPLDKFL